MVSLNSHFFVWQAVEVEREAQKRTRFRHEQETMVRIAFRKIGMKGQGGNVCIQNVCIHLQWLPANFGPARSESGAKWEKVRALQVQLDDAVLAISSLTSGHSGATHPAHRTGEPGPPGWASYFEAREGLIFSEFRQENGALEARDAV